MSHETALLNKYEKVDVEKFVAEQDATGGLRKGTGAAAYGAGQMPVSDSWLTWNVKLPSRVALVSMACIFIYEVLVGVSMGVRVLRFVMVSWLAWFLLAINVILLLILGCIVAYHKIDWSALGIKRSSTATASKNFEE
jgi:hypothetical protein